MLSLQADFLPFINQCISIFEKKIVDYFIPSSRSNEVLTQALQYRHIKKLYDQANATPSRMFFNGPWTLEFVDDMQFKGRCYPLFRKIYIRSNLTNEEAISTFVFELTNAIHTERISQVMKKGYLGQIDSEEFTKQSEQIEYEGQAIHHAVISKTFIDFEGKLDIFANRSKDFETYWNNNKDSPHANAYRKQWKLMRMKSLGFAALLIAEMCLVFFHIRNKMRKQESASG